MPSSAGEDGTDGLGAVPSVLQISRTDGRGLPSDGTVDNTDHCFLTICTAGQPGRAMANTNATPHQCKIIC